MSLLETAFTTLLTLLSLVLTIGVAAPTVAAAACRDSRDRRGDAARARRATRHPNAFGVVPAGAPTAVCCAGPAPGGVGVRVRSSCRSTTSCRLVSSLRTAPRRHARRSPRGSGGRRPSVVATHDAVAAHPGWRGDLCSFSSKTRPSRSGGAVTSGECAPVPWRARGSGRRLSAAQVRML